VPDQVRALSQLRNDQLGVLLEVDTLDGRAGWEARTIQDDELPALGQQVGGPPVTLPWTSTTRSIARS
jgi:hypothetical protein